MPQRTTLTLDDAVAQALKDEAREQGVPIKTLANAALKAGLAALKSGAETKPYRLMPKALGQPGKGIDLTKALALSDELENDILVDKAGRHQ